MKEIAIIGGGLSGLINAILLNRAGFRVKLFEEKNYPFHRVCGEYISNEVVPFLKNEGLYPKDLGCQAITKFHLSSPRGKSLRMPLDLGGFGISRYAFDQWLFNKASNEGVRFFFERVVSCEYRNDAFYLTTREGGAHEADLAIGSFGKRSMLDKSLERNFLSKKSPYIGVKYHIETDEVANDVVELHNFREGYCGVSRIENSKFNLCYLSHRSNLRVNSSVSQMENEVLFQNPHLKRIFTNSTFLFDKPAVINEITFEPKEAVFNHILMSGDSAGMITPLCGNGMAMAMHSAKLLSELITRMCKKEFDRGQLEDQYRKLWEAQFAKRLWAGRKIQHLFGAPTLSEFAVGLAKTIHPIGGFLMRQTHGDPF